MFLFENEGKKIEFERVLYNSCMNLTLETQALNQVSSTQCITHIAFIRNSSIRNLYSTFYPIAIEVQYVIVLITMEKKRKIPKLQC